MEKSQHIYMLPVKVIVLVDIPVVNMSEVQEAFPNTMYNYCTFNKLSEIERFTIQSFL